jgi:hypothetical protein
MSSKAKNKFAKLIEKYLLPANSNLIRCVDERQALDSTNGVEIPGATYSIVDAIKHFKGVGENEAWELAIKNGIPIGAHIDDHHGPLGCGYGKLVETNPKAVLAPESVPVAKRLKRVEEANGLIMHYLGEHHPTHAIINWRKGFSIDPDQAAEDGLGIFNCDIWIVAEFAKRLDIDPLKMTKHIEDVFRRTVIQLSSIRDFYSLR